MEEKNIHSLAALRDLDSNDHLAEVNFPPGRQYLPKLLVITPLGEIKPPKTEPGLFDKDSPEKRKVQQS
jgi:hypothetical protein